MTFSENCFWNFIAFYEIASTWIKSTVCERDSVIRVVLTFRKLLSYPRKQVKWIARVERENINRIDIGPQDQWCIRGQHNGGLRNVHRQLEAHNASTACARY